MKYIISTLSLFIIVLLIFCFYYARWQHLWALEQPQQRYELCHHQDDTLRVVMIGDSWAGMHLDFDSFMIQKLEKYSRLPVLFESKGKGGEKTKGVYQLMFKEGSYGTKQQMLSAPDYCVISAGINDAAANLGTKQFCYYYRQILDFLLANGIRPVVLEIPNVNIWHLYGAKPLKDLVVDFVRSTMTRCIMYQFADYRAALYQMLLNEELIDKVVYIPMSDWNDGSPDISKHLFLSDQIHLNRRGYEKIDSCIAIAIAKDLENSSNSSLVY